MASERRNAKRRQQMYRSFRDLMQNSGLINGMQESEIDSLVDALMELSPIDRPLTIRAPLDTKRQSGKPNDQIPPSDPGNIPPEVF